MFAPVTLFARANILIYDTLIERIISSRQRLWQQESRTEKRQLFLLVPESCPRAAWNHLAPSLGLAKPGEHYHGCQITKSNRT